ncbi:MAG: TIM-barrel domain-containing protein [Mangrovibacterium sp.]
MSVKLNLQKSRIFILFFVLTGLMACSPSGKKIKILNTGDGSFAALEVINPYGRAVSLNGDGQSGAIGYELDGQLNWLKGRPVTSTQKDGSLSFRWAQSQPAVVLQVRVLDRETEFAFSLESDEKPSAWMISLAASEKEYFTGIFERVVDGAQTESWKKGIRTGMNLRGERVDVKLKPTVSAYAPFYLSSENYAFFVHGTWPGVIDFCREKPDRVQIRFEGPELAFSLMTDESPAALVKHHALKTGPSFVPPRWAFGPWRWRDEHRNHAKHFDGSPVKAPYNSDIVEDILMMQAYDIPCTAYWIDRPWGPGTRGFDDYEVDEDRLPAFEEMIGWLNAKDIELMMWIGPFVMGEMANVAEQRGYDLVSKEWKNSHQVLMDFTNEEGARWWGENGPGKLARIGVKGFKLDRADGEKLCDSLHLVTDAGTTYRENFNDYPRQYVKAAYEGVRPVLGDNFILFPRAQYTGSAKYGAMWAGDTGNPAEGLRSALIGMQRCAVMGYPVWGSDTGGYPKRLEREIAMRWMGFSCFSPVMEVGPTNDRGFWGMNYDPAFDRELLAVWRFYASLRMSLVDYLHGLAVEAGETGMPVARPLFLEYPGQPESWNDWNTYKLGPDLLVSVIWEEGKTEQEVYLPAGETWINLWDKKEYEGGSYRKISAAIHQIPVFLRKGSSLELPDLDKLYAESVEISSKQYSMRKLEALEGWK